MLVDNSKTRRWIERQLRPSYHWRKMAPVFIFLTRDGWAVVNSLMRKYPEKGIEHTTLSCKRWVEDLNDFYQQFPPDNKLTVSYESLATQPSEIIRGLCEFLQLEYEPEMLDYWKHEHHPIEGNMGTRSLIFK